MRYQLQSLGVNNTPFLHVSYKDVDSNKTRLRKMPLREFTSPEICMEALKERHSILRNVDKDKLSQCVAYLLRLDLNKLSPAEAKIWKDKMQTHFEKKRVKPGDEDFVYDKRQEFSRGNEANEWDEESASEQKNVSISFAPEIKSGGISENNLISSAFSSILTPKEVIKESKPFNKPSVIAPNNVADAPIAKKSLSLLGDLPPLTKPKLAPLPRETPINEVGIKSNTSLDAQTLIQTNSISTTPPAATAKSLEEPVKQNDIYEEDFEIEEDIHFSDEDALEGLDF